MCVNKSTWLHNLLFRCHLENSQRKGKSFNMSQQIDSDDTTIYKIQSKGDNMETKQGKTTSMVF